MSSAAINAGTGVTTQAPAPSTDEPQVPLSAACALLALMVQSQTISQSGSKTDAEADYQKMEEIKKQLADAIEHAQDAAKHSGFLGFLGDVFGSDVAEIAGAVAALAATAATGGAAAPLLLLALTEGLQLGAKVAEKNGLDPKLCALLSVASVAVGLFTGSGEAQAASTFAEAARGVSLGAQLTGGAATATGAVFNLEAAHYNAQSLGYQADAVRHQAADDATSLDFDAALDALQRALKAEQRDVKTVSAINQDNNASNSSLIDRI
jgi:hypothetical protein